RLHECRAIEAIRRQRVVFAETVVEEAGADANHRLRRTRAVGRTGRPRDRESRGKVILAVRVRLCFVTQAVTQREVRSQTPIILNKHTVVCLLDAGQRAAGVDAERRRAATGRTNLFGRQALLLQEQRSLITLDARQAKPSGERPGAAEVVLVRVVDTDVTNAPAKLDRVRSLLLRSEIVQLPEISFVEGMTDLRTAGVERAAHVERRNRVV